MIILPTLKLFFLIEFCGNDLLITYIIFIKFYEIIHRLSLKIDYPSFSYGDDRPL